MFNKMRQLLKAYDVTNIQNQRRNAEIVSRLASSTSAYNFGRFIRNPSRFTYLLFEQMGEWLLYLKISTLFTQPQTNK